MLFNSYQFIFVFLPIVLVGTFLAAKKNTAWALWWLSLASLGFYAYWNPRFVLLLMLSIIFNYVAALWMLQRTKNNSNKQNRCIAASTIVIDLLVLAYFKYTNFFIEVSNDTLHTHFFPLNLVLPLGVSFFTFTQIAFVIDVFKGIAREHSFVRYLLFVTYFPHLIAGPVLHHAQMMPQFANPKCFQINAKNIGLGVTVFVLGLSKKIYFADNFGEIANPVFEAAEMGQSLTFFAAWVGAAAYTLQLYFDFSGYSDMAIGLSLMFNVRLPLNFNSPYKSASMIDFWRRWHMTLSSFLRDYLYIPLGGNRKGEFRRYLNILITMLLGGLWHGAGWTFIVWGLLHGFYLMVNHGWRSIRNRIARTTVGPSERFVGCVLTFMAIVVAWVFFRASNLESARSIISSMAGVNGIAMPETFAAIVPDSMRLMLSSSISFTGIFPPNLFSTTNNMILSLLLIGLVWVWALPNTHQIMRTQKIVWEDLVSDATRRERNHETSKRRWSWRLTPPYAICIGILFFSIVVTLATHQPSQFLYYQF